MSSDLNEKKITVLVFAAYYLPGYKGGGPIKTVKNLCDQLSGDVSFMLVTRDRDLGDTAPYVSVVPGEWNEADNAKVFYVCPGRVGLKQITDIVISKNYDIIYLNSFFSPRYSLYPLLLAKLLRQRVVLSPRGEFSGGALGLKSLKKRVYICVYKALRLHKNTVFQVSSKFEERDLREALGRKVDVQVAENIGAKEFGEAKHTRVEGVLRTVFVSRISPMKNILMALESLRKVRHPLVYDIYGPVEDKVYWDQCQAVIKTLPDHIKVEYKGALNPVDVVKTMTKYDAFYLPTKGENYGHAIAEAICAGLPILIADTTPWRNLKEQGIGWDLPIKDPSAFSAVLDTLAGMSDEEYQAMRERVLSWARNKFSQRDAIEANIALFKYAYEKK